MTQNPINAFKRKKNCNTKHTNNTKIDFPQKISFSKKVKTSKIHMFKDF